MLGILNIQPLEIIRSWRQLRKPEAQKRVFHWLIQLEVPLITRIQSSLTETLFGVRMRSKGSR